MSVVSDTTAITTLLKAKEQRLLQELFERVFIPQAVWDELNIFHTELPEFVELRLNRSGSQRLPGTELLGCGEAEALLLAKELNAQLLLTDDRKARLDRGSYKFPASASSAWLFMLNSEGRFPLCVECCKHSKRREDCICRIRSVLMLSDWLAKPDQT